MPVLRLVTVHPILTHFTIGALPILLLAYAMAYARRSEKWTFAGDATLIVTALITVLTAAFGLVSNFVLEWPGGLGTWRWLHLGFGAATAGLFLAFAIVRLIARRRRTVSGAGALLATIGMLLVITFTGWIGGELLVYRSGMAVTAAGDGALAPPVDEDAAGPPADLVEAMHRLRADWAASQSTLAQMIVEEPHAEGFEEIARHADEMARVSDWVAGGAPSGEEGAPEGGGQVSLLSNRLYASVDQSGGEPGGSSPNPLAPMARRLADQARTAAEAARSEDIAELTDALGELSSTCTGCHAQFRWGKEHEH